MQNQKIPAAQTKFERASPINDGRETLTWKAPSHFDHKRSSGWYLALAFVALGLLAFVILYDKSLISLITFVLIIIVVFILSMQPTREVTYKITKTGIHVSQTVYDYKVIKKFWIVYNPPDIKTLNFETTAYLNSKISLQLGRQDPLQVKMVLNQYLPEDLDREESMSEVLARRLKI